MILGSATVRTVPLMKTTNDAPTAIESTSRSWRDTPVTLRPAFRTNQSNDNISTSASWGGEA